MARSPTSAGILRAAEVSAATTEVRGVEAPSKEQARGCTLQENSAERKTFMQAVPDPRSSHVTLTLRQAVLTTHIDTGASGTHVASCLLGLEDQVLGGAELEGHAAEALGSLGRRSIGGPVCRPADAHDTNLHLISIKHSPRAAEQHNPRTAQRPANATAERGSVRWSRLEKPWVKPLRQGAEERDVEVTQGKGAVADPAAQTAASAGGTTPSARSQCEEPGDHSLCVPGRSRRWGCLPRRSATDIQKWRSR